MSSSLSNFFEWLLVNFTHSRMSSPQKVSNTILSFTLTSHCWPYFSQFFHPRKAFIKTKVQYLLLNLFSHLSAFALSFSSTTGRGSSGIACKLTQKTSAKSRTKKKIEKELKTCQSFNIWWINRQLTLWLWVPTPLFKKFHGINASQL